MESPPPPWKIRAQRKTVPLQDQNQVTLIKNRPLHDINLHLMSRYFEDDPRTPATLNTYESFLSSQSRSLTEAGKVFDNSFHNHVHAEGVEIGDFIETSSSRQSAGGYRGEGESHTHVSQASLRTVPWDIRDQRLSKSPHRPPRPEVAWKASRHSEKIRELHARLKQSIDSSSPTTLKVPKVKKPQQDPDKSFFGNPDDLQRTPKIPQRRRQSERYQPSLGRFSSRARAHGELGILSQLAPLSEREIVPFEYQLTQQTPISRVEKDLSSRHSFGAQTGFFERHPRFKTDRRCDAAYQPMNVEREIVRSCSTPLLEAFCQGCSTLYREKSYGISPRSGGCRPDSSAPEKQTDNRRRNSEAGSIVSVPQNPIPVPVGSPREVGREELKAGQAKPFVPERGDNRDTRCCPYTTCDILDKPVFGGGGSFPNMIPSNSSKIQNCPMKVNPFFQAVLLVGSIFIIAFVGWLIGNYITSNRNSYGTRSPGLDTCFLQNTNIPPHFRNKNIPPYLSNANVPSEQKVFAVPAEPSHRVVFQSIPPEHEAEDEEDSLLEDEDNLADEDDTTASDLDAQTVSEASTTEVEENNEHTPLINKENEQMRRKHKTSQKKHHSTEKETEGDVETEEFTKEPKHDREYNKRIMNLAHILDLISQLTRDPEGKFLPSRHLDLDEPSQEQRDQVSVKTSNEHHNFNRPLINELLEEVLPNISKRQRRKPRKGGIITVSELISPDEEAPKFGNLKSKLLETLKIEETRTRPTSVSAHRSIDVRNLRKRWDGERVNYHDEKALTKYLEKVLRKHWNRRTLKKLLVALLRKYVMDVEPRTNSNGGQNRVRRSPVPVMSKQESKTDSKLRPFYVGSESADDVKPPANFPWKSIRLPEGIRPAQYDLRLHPDLDTELLKGQMTIQIDVKEKTDFLVLHAGSNVNISHDSVTISSGSKAHGIREIQYFEHWQQVAFLVNESLPGQSTIEFRCQFQVPLTEEMFGAYLSKYKDRNGIERKLVSTQFEPTFARIAFPCFDEPDMKAVVQIRILRKKEMKSLSNMPLKKTEDLSFLGADNPLEEDHFENSPRMSTYLIAFLICEDMAQISNTSSGGVLISVVVPSSYVDQIYFARDMIIESLNFYEKLFNQNYSLPKLDAAGIPSFANAGMENWGLMTFRLSCLFYREGVTQLRSQLTVVHTVAHEVAHQWFGNLVTMSWWNDLWLNEGLASFLQQLASNKIKPELEESFRSLYVQNRLEALALDETSCNQAVVPADSAYNREPEEVFNTAITYRKAASILRMLFLTMGEGPFVSALQDYLQRNKFSNTKSDDMWKAFQEKAENFTHDVKDLMDSWIKQSGFPVISVTRIGNKLHFNQSRYTLATSPPPTKEMSWY
ncbi:unnamed protein product [Cyprideis torosa]|uniref:Uncharacterized protein n=1 Tax=Cyprideis torosa TaxID=163714 RepID=A0A7R8ZHU3_9CRUS|nr:unnamed protein product [Cyprideis torosa]CAG0884562.1 unnamed protein product [Cyprideis torosa]